jgi:predicted RNA-binding protein with PIN domain
VTRWTVDGMNLIGSRPNGWWRDRPRAMRELVDELGAFARSTGDPLVVVFDGRPFELDTQADTRGPELVNVRFASSRGRNAADDDIAALVAEDGDPASLSVVTADGHLASRVRDAGGTVVGAGVFRRRLGG